MLLFSENTESNMYLSIYVILLHLMWFHKEKKWNDVLLFFKEKLLSFFMTFWPVNLFQCFNWRQKNVTVNSSFFKYKHRIYRVKFKLYVAPGLREAWKWPWRQRPALAEDFRTIFVHLLTETASIFMLGVPQPPPSPITTPTLFFPGYFNNMCYQVLIVTTRKIKFV